MRKTNKKGFTVVELVIVIAIIAVLAAVLIPTFAGVIKTARLSADKKAVQEMTSALSVATAEKKPANLDELVDALAAKDFNSEDSLIPVSKGHGFFWNETKNKIFLAKVDANGNPTEVVFPEKSADLIAEGAVNHALKGGYKYVDITAGDAKTLEKALAKGNEKITLTADVTLNATTPVTGNVTIILGEYDINASANGARPFDMYDGASLTIVGENTATVTAGKYGLVNIQPNANVDVVLEGGNYVANTDNGAFIKVRAGDADVNVTLKNVNYVDNSNDGFLMNRQGFVGNLTLNVDGGSYKANAGFSAGDAVIKNATITTNGFAVELTGNGEVTDCTITTGSATVGSAPAAGVAVASGGTATVTGCTITTGGHAFYAYSSGGAITANGNTVTGAVAAGVANTTTYPGATVSIVVDGVPAL